MLCFLVEDRPAVTTLRNTNKTSKVLRFSYRQIEFPVKRESNCIQLVASYSPNIASLLDRLLSSTNRVSQPRPLSEPFERYLLGCRRPRNRLLRHRVSPRGFTVCILALSQSIKAPYHPYSTLTTTL